VKGFRYYGGLINASGG